MGFGDLNKMPYDIICPCYWVDPIYFEDNLQSWIKEIQPNRVLLGINNPLIQSYLEELQQKYPVIELIDQLHLHTLGGCLADLIKKVHTDWYVFVHTDVKITPYAFLVMQQYQKEDVGIIESHREHWDGSFVVINDEALPQYKPSDYYFRGRSFSGLQLIQKKAIMSLVERLEDDELYRNEDMIFHAECVKNGYKYCKTWAMHIHQIMNKNWTVDDAGTHGMQFRGFIKYTDPNKITIFPCISALQYMKRAYGETIASVLGYCYKYNLKWAEKIIEVWESLE